MPVVAVEDDAAVDLLSAVTIGFEPKMID